MKTKSRKLLSTLLTVMMVLSLFAAFPLTASAAAPAAPSNLKATSTTTSSITLTWSSNSNDETGFQIARRELNVTWGNWDDNYIRVGKNVTTFTDNALAEGQLFEYRVRATKVTTGALGNPKIENSDWSNIFDSTVRVAQPAAPFGLIAEATSGGIKLTWTFNENENNASEIVISRSEGTADDFMNPEITPPKIISYSHPSATTYTDTTAEPGKTYTYKRSSLTPMNTVLCRVAETPSTRRGI